MLLRDANHAARMPAVATAPAFTAVAVDTATFVQAGAPTGVRQKASGNSPNGSEKLTGSPPAYPYRLSPPASPIGSGCVNRPGLRSSYDEPWRVTIRSQTCSAQPALEPAAA